MRLHRFCHKLKQVKVRPLLRSHYFQIGRNISQKMYEKLAKKFKQGLASQMHIFTEVILHLDSRKNADLHNYLCQDDKDKRTNCLVIKSRI